MAEGCPFLAVLNAPAEQMLPSQFLNRLLAERRLLHSPISVLAKAVFRVRHRRIMSPERIHAVAVDRARVDVFDRKCPNQGCQRGEPGLPL